MAPSQRQIQEIMKLVDSSEFNIALYITNSILSEDPCCHQVLALKALILEKIGKPEEALSLCLKAKRELITDDDLSNDEITLNTISTVCENLDSSNIGVVEVWNDQVELSRLWFQCSIRDGSSYMKQAKMALALYDVTAEEQYLLWAVCCIQLQVVFDEPSDSVRKVKLLNLAKVLLEWHIDSQGLHDKESLLVYIAILEQQKDYEAASEIIKGELGTRLIGAHDEVDRLRILGGLLACGSQKVAAAETFKSVLEAGSDDWEIFLDYLGCLLEDDSRWAGGATVNQIYRTEYVDCKLQLSRNALISRMDHVLDFVRKLQSETDSELLRWPYLAKLEIERRKRLRGMQQDSKLMDAFIIYFRRFGDMPSFISDVKMFLDEEVCTDHEDMVLAHRLHQSLFSPSILQVKCFDGLMTIHKIQDWSGNLFNIPILDAETSVLQKTELYLDNIGLSNDLNLKKTAVNDELLCLACSTLLQLFWRTQQLDYLVVAIIVLEFGLTVQRSFCQYKILLVHLYTQLSALPLAYERFKTLDIKDIRWETFSHHILPQMLTSPFWDHAEALLKGYLSFMDHHYEESAELTSVALRHRNYSKVIEIARLKDQLQHSHQYLVARLESPILQLKRKSNDIKEVETVLADLNYGLQLLELSSEELCLSLTFNGDTESRPWWTPNPVTNYLQGPFDGNVIRHQRRSWRRLAESKQLMETNMRNDIKRRSLLPRLIYLSIQSISLLTKQELYDGENFELEKLLLRYARTLEFHSTAVMRKIDEMLSDQKSVFEVLSTVQFVDLISFTVFNSTLSLAQNEFDAWDKVDRLIKKCAQGLQNMLTVTRAPGLDLNLFIKMVSEPVAWRILVIQSCFQALPPFDKEDGSRLKLVAAMVGSMESLHGTLEAIIKILRHHVSHPRQSKMAVLLPHLRVPNCPMTVLRMLENVASPRTSNGDQISDALRSWNASNIATKIIEAQENTISGFLHMCKLKQQTLEMMKNDTKITSYVDQINWSTVESAVAGILDE